MNNLNAQTRRNLETIGLAAAGTILANVLVYALGRSTDYFRSAKAEKKETKTETKTETSSQQQAANA